MRSGWLSMRFVLHSLVNKPFRLKDYTCRFSRTNDHSPTLTLTLCLCWSYKTSDPRDHRTERFLVSRKMSGSWRKSVGTETRASGHTSQIFCRTLRQLLVVGSPRLPKRSRVSALTARPPKSLRRENRLLQSQRLCRGDDRTGSGDQNLAVSPRARHQFPTEWSGLLLSQISDQFPRLPSSPGPCLLSYRVVSLPALVPLGCISFSPPRPSEHEVVLSVPFLDFCSQ